MNTTGSYKKWLESAYYFFATEGSGKLSIKALAKQCGLPRTNFYYYFHDKEELLDKIIELHFNTTTENINKELEQRLHSFIPDLYLILYDFKIGVQFAKQMFNNRDIPRFNKAYKHGLAISADLIVPHFKDFLNIDLPDKTVKLLWFTLCDTWYSRLNFNDFSVESMSALSYEIIESILPLINDKVSK